MSDMMDFELPHQIKDNRLSYAITDRAIQFHGGMGCTRAIPFEHLYWRHCSYRITEGLEELQKRWVAQCLFGLGRAKRASRG